MYSLNVGVRLKSIPYYELSEVNKLGLQFPGKLR